MIKNMQHTYRQSGNKFYAFVVPVFNEREENGERHVVNAHNFYIFDERGWCWLEMLHVDINYVLRQLGNGFFKTRTMYTIDTRVDAFRKPAVVSDEWVQGSFDRGYALETIREVLGLNFQYLTALMAENEGDPCSKNRSST